MISKKTIYGLQAAILLAKRYDKGPALITDLAKEGHIPKKFLEAILLELKKAGILSSKKGKGGGYILAQAPYNVPIGNIIRVLEGSFADIYFEGDSKETNEIKMVMKEVKAAVSNILQKTSLSDIIEKSSQGQSVLNFVI